MSIEVEILEETKTATQEAYNKCREGNYCLVIPQGAMDVEFTGMPEMADEIKVLQGLVNEANTDSE